MIAYRLQPHDNLCEEVHEYLYDIDEDFTSKTKYIKRAKKIAAKVNARFNTNYSWNELFPEPKYIGWNYCKRCDTYYWSDSICGCYGR